MSDTVSDGALILRLHRKFQSENAEAQEKHMPDFSTVGMRPKIRQRDGLEWIRANTGVYANNGNKEHFKGSDRAKEGGDDGSRG